MNNYDSSQLVELLGAIEEAKRPWSPYIGLVELRTSLFCPRDQAFSMSSRGFPELGESALMHPEDVEKLKAGLVAFLKKPISDAELAAYVWWRAHHKAKP